MVTYRRNLKFWSFIDPLASIEATKDAAISFEATQNTLKTLLDLELDFEAALSIATALKATSIVDLESQGRLSLAFPLAQSFALPFDFHTALTVAQPLAQETRLHAAFPSFLKQAQNLDQTFALDADGWSNLSIGAGFRHVEALVVQLAGALTADASLHSKAALDVVEMATWLSQGQNLNSLGALHLDVSPYLTAGAALRTQNGLRLGFLSDLTIGNTFMGRTQLLLRLKSALAVAFRMAEFQILTLDQTQDLRQAHAFREISTLTPLISKAKLSVGQRLRFQQSLSLTMTARLITAHVLRLSQILALNASQNLIQNQPLITGLSLSALLKSGLRQGTPLQNQHAVSAILRQRLSVLSKLAGIWDARLTLTPTLRQVAFLRQQYALSLSTQNIVRQGAWLSNKSTLVLTPKFNPRQAVPFKQILTLQANLAGTFRNSHYLKSSAALQVALKQSLRLGVRLSNTAVMVATTQNNPRQAAPLKQTVGLSVRLISVLQQAFPLKTNPSLVTTLLSNLNIPNAYEAETYALLNRMNPVPPTVAARNAMNTYIKNLKTAGIWSLLDFVYVLAAANTGNAVLNWVSTKYTAALVNNPTFTAGKGFTFDKALAYLNTGHDPSTGTTICSQINAHFSTRTLNSTVASARDIGRPGAFLNSQIAAGNMQAALFGGTQTFALTGYPGANHFLINRGNNLGFDLWSLTGGPNTVALNGTTTPASGQTTIGDPSIISNRQVAFASSGGVMTSAQARTFITETTTLLTALGAI